MWLRLPTRRSRSAPAAVVTGSAHLPAVRAERALVALAFHAQQIDERLARVELDLSTLRDERADEADRLLDVPTQEDLLELQLHSARVSAELTRVAVELQARIDDLAVRMPDVVAEDRRLQRARTLAESILDLSDSIDTSPCDLRTEPGDWAATA